jgi:phage-related protein
VASEAQLALIIKGDASDAIKKLNDVEKEANGLGKTLGDVGKIAAGFLAANVIQTGFNAFTSGVGSSIKAASDLGESINALQVTFGKDTALLDWGKNNAAQMGLSQRAFNQLAVPLGAMLKNVGFETNNAANETQLLIQRASDMASVYNTDVSEAMQAILAGLRGQADPLEKYGVGLSAAKVEAEALAMTGKKTAKELTDQEKITARLNIIYRETAQTAGDFANTSDSLANRQRILAARVENLQARFGTFAMVVKAEVLGAILDYGIPALEKIGDVISKTIGPAVTKAASAIGGFVKSILGAVTGINSFGGKSMALSGPLGKLAGIIRTVVPQAIAFLIAKFRELQTYYESDLRPALENIGVAVREVAKVLIAAFEAVLPVLKPIFEQWVTIVKTTVGIIGNLFAIIIDLIQGDWAGAWKNFKDLIDVVWNGIKETIGNSLEVIKAAIGLAWEAIKAAAGLAWDGIVALIKEYIDLLVDYWFGLPEVIVELGKRLAEAGFEAGRKLANAIIDGIGDLASRVADKVSVAGVSLGDVVKAGSSLIPGRALGGSASGLTWVGERGPELVYLPPGSFVHDSSRSAHGSGGVTVNILGPVYASSREQAARAANDLGWALALKGVSL